MGDGGGGVKHGLVVSTEWTLGEGAGREGGCYLGILRCKVLCTCQVCLVIKH